MSFSDGYRVEVFVAEYNWELFRSLDTMRTILDISRQSNTYPEKKLKNPLAEQIITRTLEALKRWHVGGGHAPHGRLLIAD